MSRALKRKHVLRELWEDDFAPPKGDQQIVKVRCGKGNNLHEVQSAEGDVFLVSMPSKFRRVIWVKKGQYVVIDPVKEGHKVKGEIIKVLTRDHIKIYHKDNIWPSAFEDDAIKNPNAYPPNYKGIELEEPKSDDEEDSSYEEDSDTGNSDSDVELDESDVSENEPNENDSNDNNKDSDSDDSNKDSDSDDNNKDSDSDDNCNGSVNVDTCVSVNNCNDKNEKSDSKS